MKKIALFCVVFTFFVMVFSVFFADGYKELSYEIFSGAQKTFSNISDSVTSFVNEKNLLRENQTLKEKLARNHTNAEYEYIKKENEALRAALSLSEKNTKKTIAAEVTAINIHTNFSITLNKGARHGISKGDVVVFGNSLAGVVSEVFPSFAIFLPITADGRVTGVMDKHSRAGLLTGSLSLAKRNLCSLSFFDESTAPIGDEIITSGLSDVYPAGLTVGKVHNIEKNITVKTEIDFFNTRIFSVILSQ